MDEIEGFEIEENEIEKYLSSGPQTQVTPEINKIASEMLLRLAELFLKKLKTY